MLQSVLHTYQMNLGYANMLLEDIPDEQLADQPGGIVNHGAWQIGHMAVSSDSLSGLLGLERQLMAWDELFNMGSQPTADRSAYPGKADLLTALATGHERITKAAESADPDLFTQPTPNEKMRQFFPTIGDILAFVCTTHEGTHLGQLSAWRKAIGRSGSVLGM